MIKNKQIDIPSTKDGQRDSKGRFLKGWAGNPNGSSGKAISLVYILRKRLTEHPEEAESIINTLIKMGKERELGAIREIIDRIDGKSVETHRIEGELPIRLIFMPAFKEGNAIQGQTETKAITKGENKALQA